MSAIVIFALIVDFYRFGLDASACLHSAVCEIEGYKFPSDRFLLKHLSLATAS